MSKQETGKRIPNDDQVAVELRLAVRAGDVEAIRRLLRNDPALASARLVGKDSGAGTPLHLVADWPGYFPNGPEIVRLLIDAGADPNALTAGRDSPGPGDETPLHYAASTDDADVAEALIDAGGDIETPDGSIGTPLDNAVGYGCWHVARLLVARGARVDKAWHAAALGMLSRLEALLGSDPPADDTSQAFWHACTGGQRRGVPAVARRGSQLGARLRAWHTARRRQRTEHPAGECHFLAARAGSPFRKLRVSGQNRNPAWAGGSSVTTAKQQHLHRGAGVALCHQHTLARSVPTWDMSDLKYGRSRVAPPPRLLAGAGLAIRGEYSG